MKWVKVNYQTRQSDCKAEFKGQPVRAFGVKFEEHLNLRNTQTTLDMADHIRQTGHHFGEEEVKIRSLEEPEYQGVLVLDMAEHIRQTGRHSGEEEVRITSLEEKRGRSSQSREGTLSFNHGQGLDLPPATISSYHATM